MIIIWRVHNVPQEHCLSSNELLCCPVFIFSKSVRSNSANLPAIINTTLWAFFNLLLWLVICKVWEIQSRQCVHTFTEHTDQVRLHTRHHGLLYWRLTVRVASCRYLYVYVHSYLVRVVKYAYWKERIFLGKFTSFRNVHVILKIHTYPVFVCIFYFESLCSLCISQPEYTKVF